MVKKMQTQQTDNVLYFDTKKLSTRNFFKGLLIKILDLQVSNSHARHKHKKFKMSSDDQKTSRVEYILEFFVNSSLLPAFSPPQRIFNMVVIKKRAEMRFSAVYVGFFQSCIYKSGRVAFPDLLPDWTAGSKRQILVVDGWKKQWDFCKGTMLGIFRQTVI